jgi:hypothetical protein
LFNTSSQKMLFCAAGRESGGLRHFGGGLKALFDTFSLEKKYETWERSPLQWGAWCIIMRKSGGVNRKTGVFSNKFEILV